MPYSFVADSFHTKKLCSRLSFKLNAILPRKRPFCVFDPPPMSNVRWWFEAHWKGFSGLPISVNETFYARCYGWGATSEYRFKIFHMV